MCLYNRLYMYLYSIYIHSSYNILLNIVFTFKEKQQKIFLLDRETDKPTRAPGEQNGTRRTRMGTRMGTRQVNKLPIGRDWSHDHDITN